MVSSAGNGGGLGMRKMLGSWWGSPCTPQADAPYFTKPLRPEGPSKLATSSELALAPTQGSDASYVCATLNSGSISGAEKAGPTRSVP